MVDYAEPEYFPYEKVRKLKDGRICVTKTSGSALVMKPEDWKKAIADIEQLID